MAKQADLDKAYMKCAYAIAELSYAKRLQVGSIIVAYGGGIIAEGVNGTPSGFENVCEFEDFDPGDPTRGTFLVSKPEVLHAETNAIAKVAISTNSSRGATLYCTHAPCFICSRLIIQAKIKRVVYSELYASTEGLDLLRRAGIQVDKLE